MEWVCKDCHISKPFEDFYINKLTKNGYMQPCKQCRAIKDTARKDAKKAIDRDGYYQGRRDAYADYYARNREDILKKGRDRYYSHHEEELTRSRVYRENNRDDCNKRTKRWEKENHRKKLDATHRRLARIRNNFVEKVDHELIFERDKWTCQICLKKVKREDASIDHIIPLSMGGEHSYRNIVLTHLICNQYKGNGIVPQQQRLF